MSLEVGYEEVSMAAANTNEDEISEDPQSLCASCQTVLPREAAFVNNICKKCYLLQESSRVILCACGCQMNATTSRHKCIYCKAL